MSLFGIFLGLALLVLFAFKGKSLLWAAPLCAFVVALTGGLEPLSAYTESYMSGFVGFVKDWFPVFLLSAIFGKVMEVTGGAQSITHFVVRRLGSQRAIFVSILSAAIMAYGGISGFVIIFAMYPIVLGLFREANISRRLIPATIMCGSFTFATAALPGTPALQNLIPSEYFGTEATAAPITGLVCSVIMFAGAVLWLDYRARALRNKGFGYDEPTAAVPSRPEDALPNPLFAAIPFAAIVILLNVLKQDIILALLAGVILCVVLNRRYISDIGAAFNVGAASAVLAIMNTSATVGFGSVIRLVPGFAVLTAAVLGIGGSPLISEAVAVSVLAGAAGSASGGLTIALDAMSESFIAMSQASGISLDAFHRVAVIACGCLGVMPHDGGVVTYLSYCGISHKEGYLDMLMVVGVIPLASTVVAILMGTAGIL